LSLTAVTGVLHPGDEMLCRREATVD